MSAPAPQESVQQQWTARLSAARGRADAADGLVRVEVDGTGEVLDLSIEPKAMRLPSVDLAAAVRQALSEARAEARAQLAKAPPVTPSADVVDMQRALTEIGMDAQRRLGEFAAIAQQLSARLDWA